MKARLAEVFATWFGCGYSPFAPGTIGSLGALLPAMFIAHRHFWPPWFFGALGIAIIPLAIWSADVTAKARDRKDPGLVVIDEVVGQWITIAGFSGAGFHQIDWKGWLLAFLLFRMFDIWKPYPARQLEALPGGTGIVADDAMAGIYGAIVLYALGWLQLY